ncbi:Hypothetical predicted protein [Lecanosticta acicola]|uniref:Uncharacterized protein n=1 Tax=Lecanosticta acicola TaxID=111012 RepID=A0AAI8YZV6_9PEZI|nr:Hypothetical predicted protein [Lecanosticta acicola]
MLRALAPSRILRFHHTRLQRAKTFQASTGHLCLTAQARTLSTSGATGDADGRATIRRFPSHQRKPQQRQPEQRQYEQDLYNYYMEKPRLRNPNAIAYVPCRWVEGIVVGELVRELPAKIVRHPAAVLENQDSSIHHVRLALELFIARSGQEQQRFVAAELGLRTLHWLLSPSSLEKYDLLAETHLLRNLIYCIEAEKGSDYVHTWLQTAYTPAYARDWGINGQRHWKTWVLRQLVEAVQHWRGIQPAIIEFLRARDFNEGTPTDSVAYTPLKHAGLYIFWLLVGSNAPNLPADLYDRFLQSTNSWLTPGFEAQRTVTALRMSHPTSPDPLPFYQMLRHLSSRPDLPFEMRPATSEPSRAEQRWFLSIVTAMRLLDAQGEKSKSRWIFEYGRSKLPDRFQGSPVRSSFSAVRTRRTGPAVQGSA